MHVQLTTMSGIDASEKQITGLRKKRQVDSTATRSRALNPDVKAFERRSEVSASRLSRPTKRPLQVASGLAGYAAI